ncbi:MAG: hypothetical protein JF588_10375 [Caulobacterales bacterium]|nr:hypothetical protein [Caulobacterales bacterium]
MDFRRISLGLAASALISATAGGAWAADKPAKPMDFTVRYEPTAAAPNAGHIMTWDAQKGRFGFTLNVQQPDARPAVANDIQAGAYFSVTPSLRVGGSVALGDQQLTPTPNAAARLADTPKVRLETTFKF